MGAQVKSLSTTQSRNSQSNSAHTQEKDTKTKLKIQRFEEDSIKKFRLSYSHKKEKNPNLPPNLDFEKLKEGLVRYECLKGYKKPGLEIVEHKYVSESKLKLHRSLRIGAAVCAVVLNIGAALGLVCSSIKLIFSSLFKPENLDTAYSSTSKSFFASSVASLANAASHENLNWGLGSGMGLVSKFLDKPWGLALFSIFDGLNSIGMGEVRRRDAKNAVPMKNSIFNNPKLSWLKFLMPYENAIKSFKERFTLTNIPKLFSTEPYALFQAAGGGLIAGGGLLGVASLFANKMSEKIKSFFYLPYSLTAFVNLIALYRDGNVVRERANIIDGRKPLETKMMNIEGFSKTIGAPIIALNYALLGLKGIGLDFKGIFEHLAMGLRSLGFAIVSTGFAAQSAVKFSVTDLFGPKQRENLKIKVYPEVIMEGYRKQIQTVESIKHAVTDKHKSGFFEPLINADKYSELLNQISTTSQFQKLIDKSQTGLPNEMSLERALLNRYVHSRRVCALGILFFDTLLKNTTAPNLKKYLLENEIAFKVACLTHDIGHGPRSHLLEGAVCGLDNDEESIKILQDPKSEIHKEVIKYFVREEGLEKGTEIANTVLETAAEIIGFKHPLSNELYKKADFVEYLESSGGDFNCSFGLDAWDKAKYEYFANQIRLYVDNSDKKQVVYTKEGAVIAFFEMFKRLVGNVEQNYHLVVLAEESAYKLGIENENLTPQNALEMSEQQLDRVANCGIKKFNAPFSYKIRNVVGGEKAYCGYGAPKSTLWVATKESNGVVQEVKEFLSYLESDIKDTDSKLYNILKPMAKALRTATLFDITLEFIPGYPEQIQIAKPDSKPKNRTSRKKYAMAAN